MIGPSVMVFQLGDLDAGLRYAGIFHTRKGPMAFARRAVTVKNIFVGYIIFWLSLFVVVYCPYFLCNHGYLIQVLGWLSIF